MRLSSIGRWLLILLFTAGFAGSVAWGDFEVIAGWDHQLFPSYLVATATMRSADETASDDAETHDSAADDNTEEGDEDEEADSDVDDDAAADDQAMEEESADDDSDDDQWENYEVFGNPRGVLGVNLVSPGADVPVEVTIASKEIMQTSTWSGTLGEEGVASMVFPDIRFLYRVLTGNKQSIPVPVTYRVTVGDEDPEEQTVTITLRSINDCPFTVLQEDGSVLDVSYLFAAYVNEQHPFVDKILREALDRDIVDSFTGYQSGDPNEVYRQVYALWDALTQRDVRYSNITTSAAENQVVWSQHVRLIDESINNAQANCVDGSVLLASLLRKIDIEPGLVLVPGHCYLAFSLDAEGKKWVGLETTLIGSSLDETPKLEELSEVVDEEWSKESSWSTFAQAVALGNKDLEAQRERLEDPNNADYQFIPVARARRMGILPIAFDATQVLAPAR